MSALRLAAICLLTTAVVSVGGQTPGRRPQTPAERAAERIKQLQRQTEALIAEESQLLVELRKLELERQIKVEEVTAIERQRGETARQLEDAQARTDALQLIAEADRPDVESRLVQVYKLGRAGYWRLLLDVEDMRSLGHVYRTVAAMTQIDRERIQGYQRTLDALAKEQATLEARSKELVGLEAQATKARTALDRAVRSREELVASIDRRRDLHAQWTSELEAAQNRLQTSIAQLDDTSLPFRPFQGALPWPARGPISSRFGRQPSSRFGTAINRNGIEIAIAEGQPVRTVHEGVVAFADQFTGYGNLVIVEHGDGAFSLYGHLSAIQVQKGAKLEPLSVLGRTGRNPNGTPSLYFELRVDAKPVDPLQWLQKGTP